MNKIKGDTYELQIKNYIINELNKPAFLWSETPETILINSGIIGSHNQHRVRRIDNKENFLIDTGVDIIQVEDNNLCSLVQCKNGYKNGLTINDLAGFMCWTAALDKLNSYLYYTNKLSRNIRELPFNKRIIYVKQKYNENVTTEETKEFKPYDYQLKAQEEFNNKFTSRGILSLPCGTGKTLISYLCSNNYKQIIILSPLKQFAKQNLDKFIEYGYKNNTLLVDSDGERDVKEIKKFIKSNESFVISSTFCSIDIISKCEFNNPLFIIDEFHNLSKNNVTNEDDDFYKLLTSDYKILFVSATPRVYELEDEDYELDLFGPIIYNMSFTDAIKNKYITDYKIWLPSIHEDNTELDKELSIYEIDSSIKAKCKYFYSCLLNNGSRKCIIYCIDTKEITQMINGMKSLNEFYALDYIVNQITSNNTEKERIKILNDFATNNIIQLLFSVRILDECIDIPTCDSIFITYPSKSKIRTIQRLCRCIRINKANKFKIGNIYIWCDEYDQILETLSGIKEYDLFFKDKIMINQTNFFGDSVITEFNNDKKLIDKYMIDIKEYKYISWNEKLKLVEQYIIDNNKRPSSKDKNKKINYLGNWLNKQKKNEYTMNTIKKKKWSIFVDNYKNYFLNNQNIWVNNLNLLENYINQYNKIPASDDKLYIWLSKTMQNYKKEENIMKDINIKDKWEIFIKKYQEYFKNNEKNFLDNLKLSENYIIKNNKRPSHDDSDREIKKLGKFLSHCVENYKDKKQIMKNENIRHIWKKFLDTYNIYFELTNNTWKNNSKLVINYIEKENKAPSSTNKNIEIKRLGTWLSHQKQNYKNKKGIMCQQDIKQEWEAFVKKYEQYL
jgi:superfamily II DNA or RNA helicase